MTTQDKIIHTEFRVIDEDKEDKIQFVKNNMLDLIPIAKKLKEEEIKKDIIEDLNYKIEELREYLNVPLESSQDISDLSLRQIIDLEIDHKGYLIDYIEFEKLRAELKGIQS